ncbi:Redoxin [Polychaeton citri CBS 116435]|uniref:Thioredoxin peroxidase n=1 Tax=Polychaeton citri CBS 116435 TaxID=1314669 RepID=A0A9P4QIE2_9PEZI|nr:Redoxin [Polychaeton citri CBS 116435]
MTALQPGDTFPSDVTFSYIPFDEAISNGTSCGRPVNYNTSKEFANKRVILVSVPGAFTPTCSARHLPGLLENLDRFKALGVQQITIIAYNDPYVMNAWRKNNEVQDDYVLFLTDPATAFAKQIGWTKGERTGRFAIVIDGNKVTYAAKEPGSEITVSSAEALLNFLEQI